MDNNVKFIYIPSLLTYSFLNTVRVKRNIMMFLKEINQDVKAFKKYNFI